MKKTRVIILGVTGSIGESALRILRRFPERFELTGFSYHSNFQLALDVQKEFQASYVCCSAGFSKDEKEAMEQNGAAFLEQLTELCETDYDKALIAVVGSVGVLPTRTIIERGKEALLANKESLVMAGSLLTSLAKKQNALILPVDSEHNSILRLLRDKTVRRIMITASGGSLRDFTLEEAREASIEDVLKHPTWNMGAKITVDSASMVNKALEIIEAHFLFQMEYENLGAVIHPESFIHAMAQETDGTWFLHAYHPDMVYSIAYCLFYPEAPPLIETKAVSADIPSLGFFEIDAEKYPSYYLGLEAGKKGGAYPAVFNAANEAAVAAFLEKKISFYEIPLYIEKALEKIPVFEETLEGVMAADNWARKSVEEFIR